jgi:hypothetical protein
MDFESFAYKNYAINTYEELIKKERDKYNTMLNTFDPASFDENPTVLEPGSIINECSMIVGRPYLRQFILVFDAFTPIEQRPIIAKIT